MFVVQIPGVSMAASNWLPGHDVPPPPAAVAASLQAAFGDRGHPTGALFLAHSYGSTYAAFCLKHCPSVVRGCVLVEPASMLCHLPKMTQSFMYSLGADGWRSPLSVMFRLEPHVAVSLRRHFGLQNILFLDDLKGVCPAVVLVSAGDTIMASDAVLEHATKVRGRGA
jgi:pimeloyl-ACP methyl ester carboxylesterase